MASGEIDDAEAAHAEASAVGDVKSLIVGAAVHDLLAHVVHESFGDAALTSCAHHASDSTHGLSFDLSPILGFYPFKLTGTELDFSAAGGTSVRRLKR